MTTSLPAIFIGHGSPMNTLESNGYTRAWRKLGQALPRPRGILVISAHWYIGATAVTAMARPRTIHDFYGFPDELFAFQYPAPGLPELAQEVVELVKPEWIGLDQDQWGLDHGTWSVLAHLYPDADIPVVQLSLNALKPAEYHLQLGARLAALRQRGVLILGSGNVVHNLHSYAWGRHPAEPFDWALRFEAKARELMLQADHQALMDYAALGRDAELAIPTPDHYLPLLYVLGASDPGEPVTFPVEGMDGGSISMLSVQFG